MYQTFLRHRMKLWTTLMLLTCGLLSFDVDAQVTVNPGAGSYTTLNAAFAAINAGTHTGAITIAITGNTTEPATPTPLLASGGTSSYTSISIMPSGGNWTINSAATPTGNRGIIELFGADNVTIDGDDAGTPGTRNLSFVMALNATTGTTCIRLGSTSTTGTDGANNNTIKNCIITGGRNATNSTIATYGIAVTHNSTTGVTTGGYSNNNVLIENNLITRAFRGIYVSGVNATYPFNNLIIRNNTLGSAVSADNTCNGIFVSYTASVDGATSGIIEGNDIRGGDYSTTGFSASISGIEAGTVNAGLKIRKNNIHDIYNQTSNGYGAFGILISGAASMTGLTIENNFIRDMVASKYSATATTSFTNYGIRFSGGATGVKINHNTIALLVPNTTGTVANYANHCVGAMVAGVTISEFQNNILINNNVGIGTYGFYTAANTNISAGTVNNNNYFTPNGVVGYYNAANHTTLAAWQTATTKDGLSVSANPGFTSGTDLHIDLSNPGAVNVSNNGVAIPAITQDIDGDTRTATPDMGADEFVLVACSAAGGGTISPANASKCFGQTHTMTPTGSATGSGLTHQWEVSSTGGGVGFTDVTTGTGITSTTYTTSSTLAAGVYYFRLRSTCSAGPVVGYSSEVMVTINALPTTAVTPTTATYCIGGTAVALTATGASTYSWSPATGLSATTGATVNASPSANTTYTVTGTSAAGCTGTATSVITAVGGVIITSTTATPSAVCLGATSTLTVNAVGSSGSYCTAAATQTSATDNIANVTFAGINNNSPNWPAGGASSNASAGNLYSGYMAPIVAAASVTAGSTYPISVTNYHTGSVYTVFTTVNFDWNQDGDFADAGENYAVGDNLVSGVATGGVAATATIAVPAGALNGTTRMRVVMIENGSAANPYCGTFSYGEVEDYSVTVSGGVDALTYAWSPSTFLGATNTASVSATNITSTTTYTATVTNTAGCVSTGTVTVTAGSALNTPVMSNSPACSGNAYTVTATVTGGGAPYTYSWVDANFTVYPNAATITIPASAAGSYTYDVFVTDNCGASVSNTITVNVAHTPVVTSTPSTAAACGGVGVSLAASATTNGIAGTYTYSWSPAAGLSATNVASVTANPSLATTYTVTVTQPSTGCVGATTAQVNVGTNVTVSSATATPATICPGAPTSLSATALTVSDKDLGTSNTTLGGSTGNPYRSGNGTGNQIKTQLIYTAAELAAAGISAGQILGLGFTGSGVQSGTVSNFEVQIGHTTASSLTTTFETTPLTLVFTQASFTPATGINMHTFNTGNTFTWDGVSNILVQTCQTNNVLGTATVSAYTTATVQNNHSSGTTTGCTALTGLTISSKPIIRFQVNTPVTYTWMPGSLVGNPVTVSPMVTTTYTVTATSTAGCTGTNTATVTAGAVLNTPVMSNSPACSGNAYTVTATVTGGGAPYTYSWVDANFTVYPNAATITIPASAAGSYTYDVFVTDNCGAMVSNTITVNVAHTPVAVSTPSTAAACGGVGASLTASATTNGVAGTYTYSWAPATGLSATNVATVTANPSAATTYTVTVTQPSTGCISTATAAVGVGTVVTMGAVTANPPAVCPGGTSVLTASASLPVAAPCIPLTTNGCASGDHITNVSFATISNASAACISGGSYSDYTPQSTNVTAGSTYTLSISISNGGTEYGSAWIDYNSNGTFEASEFIPVTVALATTWNGTASVTIPANAVNGATRLRVRSSYNAAIVATSACDTYSYGETEDYTINISGGLSALTYVWTPGAGLATTTGASVTTNAIAAPPATFNVTATSSAGCTATGSVTVAASTPIACTNISVPATRCANTNFSLTANTTGGGGAFTYSWVDGTGTTYPNSATITVNKAAGTYNFTVYITDACGSACNMSQSVVINALPTVAIAPTPSNALICGTGSVTLLASGANTYSWTPATGLSATNVASVTATPVVTTSYVVTGTNTTTGCMNTASQTVTYGNVVTMGTISATPSTICVGTNASLSAGASDVVPTYCTANATATSITDNIANVTFAGINNNSPGWPGAATSNPSAVNGYGNYTGTTPATVTAGSTYPISVISYHDGSYYGTFTTAHFDWNKDGDFADAGETYSVGASTAAGTAVTGSILVPATATNGNTRMRIVMYEGGSAANPYCGTFSYGEVEDYTVTVSGGTPPSPGPGITYSWNNGGGVGASVTVSPSATTTYTVTASNAAGCSTTATTTVTVNPLPTATISGTTAVCQNATAPNVTFTGASGTAPYTFTYKINGGANQTVTTITGNSVTVAAPTGTAGAFAYTLVSVADANTCSQVQTGTATVTVNTLPTASISGTTSVCQNSTAPSITFTGATGAAPYTFTYTINGGANQTVTTTSGNSVTVSAPTSTNGTFTYTLVSVLDANTCSQVQTGTATVTVDEAVTATAGANQAACNTASVTMSPTVPTLGTGAWSGGAGTWAGNVYTPSATEAANGAVLTAVWTVTNNTCSATSTATITIDAPAVAIAGADVSTCVATMVTLSPTTPTLGTGVWTGGLGTWAGNNYTPTAGESNSAITVTWTVTSGTCSATDVAVIAVDTTAPTITFAPGNQTLALDSLCNAVLPNYTTMATANDNCSGYVVTQNPPAGTAVYGSGTTNVVLTVTDAANKTATTTFSVTRNLFTPTIVAGGATTFCNGGSVTLQASNNAAYSYQWYKDAVMISGANNASFVADASGSYNVAISVTGGCTLTSNAIVVNELPVPAAPTITTNPAAVSGVVNICPNASVTMTGSPAAEYLWYRNGTPINYSLSPNYTVSPSGTNVYTLVVVPTGSSCISAQSSPITVIRSSLTSTISLSGPTTYCANTPTTLSANPTGTGYSYSWEKGTAVVGTSATYVPVVGGNYSVVVSDANGCSVSSAKVTITVLATPTANAGADKSVCSNLTTIIGSNPVSTNSYSWTPSTGLSSATNSKPTVTPSSVGVTTYTVIVTNNATGCSATDAVNVTSLAVPSTPTLSGSTSPVCQGSSVVLTPNVLGAPLTVWYKNGAGLYTKPSTTTATFTAVTSTPDIYTIKGRDAAGCLSTNFSNPVSVMINEAPTPTVTSNPAAVGTTVTICNIGGTTGSATLTANSTAIATPTYSWQQLVGTTYNNIAAGNSYVASVATTPSTSNNKSFRVQATYPNGCVKTSSTTKVRILTSGCTPRDGDVKGDNDLTEIVLESDLLTAYPNPTEGILNVSIENSTASEGKLVLYNALGQIVTEVNMTIINGKGVETLDLSNVSAGVYTLSFQTEQGQKVQKVVKE